jgi:hypothetical protein
MQVPLDATLMGLTIYTAPKAKNCGTAPIQILDVQLFWWLLLIPNEFGYGTSSIWMAISLSFQGVQERPN